MIECPKSSGGIEAATRGQIWDVFSRIPEANIGAVEGKGVFVSFEQSGPLRRSKLCAYTRLGASSSTEGLSAMLTEPIAAPEEDGGKMYSLGRECQSHQRWRTVTMATRVARAMRARVTDPF
jgi:hypothetical protein